MADNPVTGADSYVQYGIETAFGTESAAITQAFGSSITINIEAKNNLISSRGLNDRNVKRLLAGNFEGTATVEGSLGTTHWLAGFWGTSATSGSAPNLHTYSESNTIKSITIENGVDLGTTDSVRKLLGCKLDEVTLTIAVGEPIKFRAVWFYKEETEGTSLDSTPALDSETEFLAAQATIEIPDGTTINRLSRLELTFKNALFRSFGIGSRTVSKIIPTTRDYSLSFDSAFENSALLEQLYGSTSGINSTVAETSADINITNGLTGASERHLQIQLSGVSFDTLSNPQKIGEQINQTISAIARAGTGLGQDSSASTVWDS